MKKTSLLILALAGALVLGGGGVFAAGQIARSSAISEKNALNFAYVDAGILPEEAETVSTKFDFEKGRFVYEIAFTAGGTRYAYTLDSGTGAVLGKETELIVLPGGTPEQPEIPLTELAETEPAAPEMISTEQAMSIALEDAGRSASEVVFTKAKQEKEDGRQIYDIEFIAAGEMEYEYEIDAYTGAILEKDSESLRPVTEPTQPVPTEPVPTEPEPTQPVPTEPVPTEPVPTQPVPTQPVPTEPVPTQPTAPEMIGLEKAKKIALQDAGLSASEVVFSKARLEKDDGEYFYEIEFFIRGEREYEYEIDPFTGRILERESEPWDD